LSDVQTMSRDDLYGHYRRFYTPSNATLVIVGDVETDDALRRAERQFGGIPAGVPPVPRQVVEPPQAGERRLTLRKGDAAESWKAAGHAPALADPDFFGLLVADAVLSGAAGLNIWSGGGVA